MLRLLLQDQNQSRLKMCCEQKEQLEVDPELFRISSLVTKAGADMEEAKKKATVALKGKSYSSTSNRESCALDRYIVSNTFHTLNAIKV